MTTANDTMSTAVQNPALVSLQFTLERGGWDIRVFDMDLREDRESVRIVIASTDGRLVTLDARNGRASITREQTTRRTERTGRRGDAFRADRIGHEFLGRDRYEGPRQALRHLAHYLVDNAPIQIAAADVRRALAATMG